LATENYDKAVSERLSNIFFEELRVNFKDVDLNELVGLRNLQKGLEDTFGKKTTNGMLENLIGNLNESEIKDFMSDLGKIDLTNAENFQKIAEAV
jgi:hypothetical protein